MGAPIVHEPSIRRRHLHTLVRRRPVRMACLVVQLPEQRGGDGIEQDACCCSEPSLQRRQRNVYTPSETEVGMKTIGIIGGAGVIAANSFLQKVETIGTSRGAYRDHHHPEVIMLHATQAPSRSLYLEGRGPSFIPSYVAACEKLAAAGADLIAMCCNTAHAAYFDLAEKSPVPLINMVGEAIQSLHMSQSTVQPIGLLCSDGTRAAKVYETHAKALGVEMEFVYPEESDQKSITNVIQMIKRGCHRHSTEPHEIVARVASSLRKSSAGEIVLACTELHLAVSEDLLRLDKVLDTVDILAQACVRLSEATYEQV